MRFAVVECRSELGGADGTGVVYCNCLGTVGAAAA